MTATSPYAVPIPQASGNPARLEFVTSLIKRPTHNAQRPTHKSFLRFRPGNASASLGGDALSPSRTSLITHCLSALLPHSISARRRNQRARRSRSPEALLVEG